MRGRFTDRDRGFRRLARQLRSTERGVTVGIHVEDGADEHVDSGTTVAAVGSFHEFGVGVPERSFLRSSVDENTNEYGRFVTTELGRAIDRQRPLDRVLGLVGLKAVADVQAKIRSGIAPALAESTKRQKGSSTPLIDTGQLINSITHKVE